MQIDIKVIQVRNSNGQTFNVRLINQGEGYGIDNKVIHKYKEPLVEFYDTRYNHTILGQFVSRYYISSILEHGENGLSLDMSVDDWFVDDVAMEDVIEWLGYMGENDMTSIGKF